MKTENTIKTMKTEETPPTYGAAVKEAEQKLWAAGVPDAGVDAAALLEFVTGRSRARQFLSREEPLSKAQAEQYAALVEKRVQRIPLQHLLGEQEFMGLSFQVNEHVLIPRQDTETLVEAVLKELHPGDSILDVCTGSGCILISLLKLNGYVTGEGVDLSGEALAVACGNAEKNGVRAEFFQSDLLKNIAKK